MDAPIVISEGRLRAKVVVPAETGTACRPLEGDMGWAAPPFTAIVPLLTQLGMRT